jgi:hypothetical protein
MVSREAVCVCVCVCVAGRGGHCVEVGQRCVWREASWWLDGRVGVWRGGAVRWTCCVLPRLSLQSSQPGATHRVPAPHGRHTTRLPHSQPPPAREW